MDTSCVCPSVGHLSEDQNWTTGPHRVRTDAHKGMGMRGSGFEPAKVLVRGLPLSLQSLFKITATGHSLLSKE